MYEPTDEDLDECLEVVDLVGGVPAEPVPAPPAPPPPAVSGSHEPAPEYHRPIVIPPVQAVDPTDLAEAVDEVANVTHAPRAAVERVVRDALGRLGGDRFYAIFWSTVGTGTKDLRALEQRFRGAVIANAPPEALPEPPAKGDAGRREAVAKAFGAIIKRTLAGGYATREEALAAIADTSRTFGIKWEAKR